MSFVNQIQDEVCALYASPMQMMQACHSTQAYSKCYAEQANTLNNFEKSFGSHFSETFNPNWHNHPNFF